MAEGRFAGYIKSRFGIVLGDEFGIDEKTNKVYVYFKGIDTLALKWVHRKGFLAGKLFTIFGIKPSLDFALVFGHLATRNFAVVNDDDVRRAYAGLPVALECPESCDDGIIILKRIDGKGAAIAFKREGQAQPLIQKDRQIARRQDF